MPLVSTAPQGFAQKVNPTHGSGWMVQVRPTNREARLLLKSHPRQWMDSSSPA